MAYDPEARKQSNSALTIGLIALAVIGLSALAYFATRPPATPETGPIITNTREKETVVVQATPVPPTSTTIVIQATPAPAAPDTVVVAPPASSSTTTTTTTQSAAPRNSQPSSNAPVASPPAEQPKTTVNNTIINPPAPAGQAQPVQPDSVIPGANDAAPAAPAADGNSVRGF